MFHQREAMMLVYSACSQKWDCWVKDYECVYNSPYVLPDWLPAGVSPTRLHAHQQYAKSVPFTALTPALSIILLKDKVKRCHIAVSICLLPVKVNFIFTLVAIGGSSMNYGFVSFSDFSWGFHLLLKWFARVLYLTETSSSLSHLL